jgi:hypothetical protein
MLYESEGGSALLDDGLRDNDVVEDDSTLLISTDMSVFEEYVRTLANVLSGLPENGLPS